MSNKTRRLIRFLKKTLGILVFIIVCLILLGLVFSRFQLEEGKYSFIKLGEDVFPEIFGIFASLFLISLVWIFSKKSHEISDYIWSFITETEKEVKDSERHLQLENSINELQRATRSIRITGQQIIAETKFNENTKNWNAWRNDLVKIGDDYSDAVSNAWQELVQAHLDIEDEYLRQKKIKNTSESYTLLISNVSSHLHKEYIENRGYAKIQRYHITGMLPEEFFNGPQIEYTNLSSTPIIYCHAFENDKYSQSHYAFYKKKNNFPSLEVKRCIVVREPGAYLHKRFSALSTIQDLELQKELLIRNTTESFPTSTILDNSNKNRIGEAERLVQHCLDHVKKYYKTRKKDKSIEFIQNVINHDTFRYYSIVHNESIKNSSLYTPLFEFYSKFFSRNMDDCYYWTAKSNSKVQYADKIFRPGYMPEIVLFALDENGDGIDNKWLLGLQGHYKPFTRDIEIEILKSYDATLLANGIIPEFFKNNLATL